MAEKNLNSILYSVFAIVVVAYLYFNVFTVVPTVSASMEESAAQNAQSAIYFQEETIEEKRNISPIGYHLYIDLDTTQMFVYKERKLIKTYEVSGGKTSTPSPEGSWKIIHKDTWGEGFGGSWMGINVPWGT